jgi:group I intron endonuclease
VPRKKTKPELSIRERVFVSAIASDPSKPTGTIYVITNRLDGKTYVGQTIIPFKSRLRDHVRKNRSLLGRAINKHGMDNFETSFSEVPYCFMDRLETNLIRLYDSLFPNGYNLDSGGSNHKQLNESTKSKISEAVRKRFSDPLEREIQSNRFKGENSSTYGKPRSDETKRKIADTLSGRHLSMEHRKHLSESKKRYA